MKRHRNDRTCSSSKATAHDLQTPSFEKKKKKKKKEPNKEKSARAHDPTEAFYDFAFQSKFTIPKSPPGVWAGYPYRTWSLALAAAFDSQLYIDFRRLALDDLFTRDLQHGYYALLEFYELCLLSEDPLPDEVIADIVRLSRSLPFNFNAVLLDLLQTTMGCGGMERGNRMKAGNFFNREFSQPLERLRSDPQN